KDRTPAGGGRVAASGHAASAARREPDGRRPHRRTRMPVRPATGDRNRRAPPRTGPGRARARPAARHYARPCDRTLTLGCLPAGRHYARPAGPLDRSGSDGRLDAGAYNEIGRINPLRSSIASVLRRTLMTAASSLRRVTGLTR